MIKYRFTIGKNSQSSFFNNDEEAKLFAEFIGATFERDTMLIKLEKDNYRCMFEIDMSQIKDIDNFEIKNVSIWETKLI